MNKTTLIIFLLMINIAYAAEWVDDPADCPVEYNSVSCTGTERQCGINPTGPAPYCYEPSSLTPPDTTETQSNNPTGSFNGGFLVDCEATDGSEPYCDNGGAFWCDYNSSCYNSPMYRKTNCTDWGEGGCSQNCRSGYEYCTDLSVIGTSNTENCNIDIGTTSCSELGGSGTNTAVQGDCACDCASGYQYCSGESTPGITQDVEGTGCNIQISASDSCSDLNAVYNNSHNDVNTNCDCTCDTGYVACEENNSVHIDGAGCDVDYGTTTGTYFGWSSTNTVIDQNCILNCTADHYNCNGDIITDGCEIGDNDPCSIGSLSGTRDHCDCIINPVEYGTSGIHYNWSGARSFLWFTQYGAGTVFNFSHNQSGNNLTLGQHGLCLNNRCTSSWDSINQTGGGTDTRHVINSTGIINQTGLTINMTFLDTVYLRIADYVDNIINKWTISNDYVINDTHVLTINETRLNNTIRSNVITYTNANSSNTRWQINNTGIINQSNQLTINESTIYNTTLRYYRTKNAENVTVVFY